jgi:NitT/TauT family transport system substrate-binding protein
VLGIADADAAETRIKVQLKWVHQAQFAGFYTALENGYYADEGLDVVLVPGGNEVDRVSAITSGTVDVAVLSPEDIIIKRRQGLPLKAIAAIYRRSAVVYLSRQGSGIHRPEDFSGKTIATIDPHGSLRDFQYQLKAMMNNLGLGLDDLKLLPYDPDYTGFLAGTVDVTAAYITGGLVMLRQKGHRPNLIWPGDYRVRFYSDTLATTDQMITQQPERISRFLRATLKGWQTAIGNPAATVDIVLKHALIQDRALQTAMFDAMIPLVHTGEDNIGWMHAHTWREMHRVLVEQGIIDRPLDPVEQLYTMRFLEEIYGDEE